MSQKSSVPQAAKFVSQALKRDSIDAAKQHAASTDNLTKPKKALQSQLEVLNGRIADYNEKIIKGKDTNGIMAASIDALQQKASGLRDKLETLNNEQKLATQNAQDIIDTFEKAAVANTNLGFQN